MRSSGNQAECGLRETANLFKETYPQVHKIIHKDVYVDDCISGESSISAAHSRADELQHTVNKSGFRLKGITFSGSNPPPDLTDDRISIAVGGMNWFPKTRRAVIEHQRIEFEG